MDSAWTMRLDLDFRDPLWQQSGLECGECGELSTNRHHPRVIGVVPQVQGTKAEGRQADLRAA